MVVILFGIAVDGFDWGWAWDGIVYTGLVGALCDVRWIFSIPNGLIDLSMSKTISTVCSISS